MEVNLSKLKQTMIAQTHRNNVLANNLANLNTVGFKKDFTFFERITDKLSTDVKVNLATNFDQGLLYETNNPLDMALSGKGFFTVETENGLAYTRDGHFKLDNEGILRTSAGLPVLGDGGWIVLGTGEKAPQKISVNKDGYLSADGEMIVRLRISDFEDTSKLRKAGGNLFTSSEDNVQFEPLEISVEQGFLESANVNAVEEMMGLIEVQRQFESSQNMIRTLDEAYKNATNQVSRY